MAASTILPGNMPGRAERSTRAAPRSAAASGRTEDRLRHVGRHRGRAQSAHHGIRAHGDRRWRFRRDHRRQAPEHRHRADARFPARGARPPRANRGDSQRGSRGHGGCRNRRSAGRAFCADQMPAADQRPHRGGPRQRPQDRHHQRLWLDGLFPRRLGAGRRRRTRRDRQRYRRRARSQELGFVFLGGLDLGRHRTDAQCRHRARQFARLGEPVCDRTCRDARRDRFRTR